MNVQVVFFYCISFYKNYPCKEILQQNGNGRMMKAKPALNLEAYYYHTIIKMGIELITTKQMNNFSEHSHTPNKI